VLCFITNGTDKKITRTGKIVVRKTVATLGTMGRVTKEDLKKYVRRFDMHWWQA